MCGFCRITDLGILLFNFSSKNHSSKVYTYLEEVVVLVTHHHKVVFSIFGFFYDFISIFKFQPTHIEGVRIFMHAGPWNF
jgi:hypothetical protein